MKKILIVLLLFPLLTFSQEAKDTLWTTEGNVTLNFSQVSLTNWAAGGKSSVTGVFIANMAANYKKDKLSWDNSADIRYGFLKEEDSHATKSDDNIDLSSKLGIEATGNWHYAGLLNFKSQFAPGYNYPDTDNAISDFMAPGYLNMGIGMDYKTDNLSVLMAPLAGKFTFVTNDILSAEGAFGVDEGKKVRGELGALVKVEYKTDIMKNVTFNTKLDLFSNYLEKPQNIDIDWNAQINMKVNEFLTANIVTHMIYDDDIDIDIDNNNDGEIDESGPRLQFMEMFGVGLTFKF
ncbi:MAG: DUF3078 domain-containing protein [Bacteroidota bacterium]